MQAEKPANNTRTGKMPIPQDWIIFLWSSLTALGRASVMAFPVRDWERDEQGKA
jgi:hypothetical protein